MAKLAADDACNAQRQIDDVEKCHRHYDWSRSDQRVAPVYSQAGK
jgi:hypothetical protein